VKIWKQLLRPDIWYKTARGWFCPSKDDCRQYVEGTKRALANKVPIPVPLEHHRSADPSQLPLSRDEAMAAMVGLNTGWVEDLRINRDGSIDAQLEVDWVPDGNGQPIRDESEIRARLENSIKFVSPYIVSDLTDGHGNSYGKGIMHVALTAQPVDHGQRPFGTVALGRQGLFLSLAHSRSTSMPTETAEPKTEMTEPKTVEELRAAVLRLLEEAGDDVQAAVTSLCEYAEELEGEEEEDEENAATDHDTGAAVPAAPVPQFTALSRAGAPAEDHGDRLARFFSRPVPGLAPRRNSH
jgi:hypothetical protein